MIAAAILAILDSVIFVVIGILHLYWAVGGSWGLRYAMPLDDEPGADEEVHLDERFGRPGKLLARLIAFICFVTVLILLTRVGIVNLPLAGVWVDYYCWAAAAVLFLRSIGNFKTIGLFKRHRTNLFARWDTRLFSPLTLFLALTIAGINLLATP